MVLANLPAPVLLARRPPEELTVRKNAVATVGAWAIAQPAGSPASSPPWQIDRCSRRGLARSNRRRKNPRSFTPGWDRLTFTQGPLTTMKTRFEHQSGFTLIELLVVIVILGVLAALAFPAYASMVRRARYAEVKQHMGTIAKEVQMHYLENGQYPNDVGAGTPPQGVTNWPDRVPLNGSFDYDHWGVGSGQCYVQIGFNGDDAGRNYSVHQVNAAPQTFEEFEDDLVLGVDLYDCPIAQGPIRN